MIGFISKLFGGNKSEKDIKIIMPRVEQINQFSAAYHSLSNDALRAKTNEFKQRIKEHLQEMMNPLPTWGKKQKNFLSAIFQEKMPCILK